MEENEKQKNNIKKVKYSKKPSIKNSFYQLYKKQIAIISKSIGALACVVATGFGLYKLSKYVNLAVLIFILMNSIALLAAAGFMVYGLSQFVMFMFNQRRIPLTTAEFKEFGITSIEEYSDFLFNLLHGIAPNKEILNRIIISGTLQFRKSDFIDDLKNIVKGDIESENYSLTNKIEIEDEYNFNRIKDKVFGSNNWLTRKDSAKNSVYKIYIGIGFAATALEAALLGCVIINII